MAAPPTLFDINQILTAHAVNYSQLSEGNTYFHDFQVCTSGIRYRLVKNSKGEVSLHEKVTGHVVAQGITPCWQYVNELFRLRPQLKLNF